MIFSSELQLPKTVASWTIVLGRSQAARRLSRVVWSDDSITVRAEPTSNQHFSISFGDAVEVELDFRARNLWVQTQRPVDDSIRHLLADQIAPRIIAHGGELVLHAAAVKFGAAILLFVGESGSGKSTLAASLSNAGYDLMGDDAIIVSASDGFVAARSIYRSLRLFPDSVQALVDSHAVLTPVADYTTKQNVVYSADDQSDEPWPIGAVFVLDDPRGNTVELELLTASEACMALLEHSFWMDPTDLEGTKGRTRQASILAANVRAFRLAYTRDYLALPLVHDALAGALS